MLVLGQVSLSNWPTERLDNRSLSLARLWLFSAHFSPLGNNPLSFPLCLSDESLQLGLSVPAQTTPSRLCTNHMHPTTLSNICVVKVK